MAFLNKGIKITLKDERAGKEKNEEFHYEGGLKEFVKHLNMNKEPLHPDVIYFEVADKEREVEVAMQYTDRYNEMLLSYANNINTTEGGFHMVGFKTALTRIINDYAKRTKILKENDDSLSGEDVQGGSHCYRFCKAHRAAVRRTDRRQSSATARCADSLKLLRQRT